MTDRSDDAIIADLATEDGSEGRHAVDLAQCACHAGQERSATGLMLCRFGGVHRRRGDTLWHHPGDEALVPISALVAAEARAEKAEGTEDQMLTHLTLMTARVVRLSRRAAAVEAALAELSDVRVYGERNSTYYCGAQTMAKRIRAALAAPAPPREDVWTQEQVEHVGRGIEEFADEIRPTFEPSSVPPPKDER